MNLENLEKLAQWLEDGAPHVVFNMNFGLLNRSHDPDLYDEAIVSGIGDCGTVCCIAGAAVFPLRKTELEPDEDHWDDIKPLAMELLGLPDAGLYMGHPLFDPDLAPEGCTPQQAAVAVRRVMEGLHPWT